jgi:glutamate N-acetyltransferase/amino-acid N-acetyltransferase
MIAPDMATMLASSSPTPPSRPVLQTLLSPAARRTFNCVTVDGDTSTSDTCCCSPPGSGARRAIDPRPTTPCWSTSSGAGRGAARPGACSSSATARAPPSSSTINGDGASSERPRRARSAWPSPTRRWSRPRSPARTPTGAASSWPSASPASGRPRQAAHLDRWCAHHHRRRQVVPNYDEAPVAAAHQGLRDRDRRRPGHRPRTATVWTCDLTHGYIDINGSYRS